MHPLTLSSSFFFFNDTATTEIYTLSLHDALPIYSDEDLPEPEVPAIAEDLVQQTQEEQMLRGAMAALTPQCRRLVELLFYEVPARPYAEVAKELGLAVGSIGFTRQRCIERLRRQLEDLGFSDARNP